MPEPADRLNAALEERYRIVRELGEGGMATVHLAEDLKHRRRVAIKVLKPELAAVVGAERFLAEIETTAKLQHPHVLPLFDSGEADGFLFYVMPYVEGESLRERLERERQLPVDEAVRIAGQVAGALQYAHEQGVVHRDIKPANILLSRGEPVVADFGVALAVSSAGGGRLTETGLSLGTPHYMSPEQATGDPTVGPAADIYALGCVLYEMLVGEPPYTGSTAQAVLGRIISGSPDPVTEHRKAVPPHVEATLERALEKLPADRFRNASEFARALTDPGFRHRAASGATGDRSGAGWRRLAMAASVVALASLTAAGTLWFAGSDAPAPPVVRFTVPVGEGAEVYLGGREDARWGQPVSSSLAFSSDGTLLVFSGWAVGDDGAVESRLYLRDLTQERARPIEGSEGGASPFFSPDGHWIGFFAGSSLRRVSLDGGTVETVVPDAGVSGVGVYGATWGDDGTIVFGGEAGLYRVAAGGGPPELVLETPTGVVRYAQPSLLPGGDGVLFHVVRSMDPEDSEIVALELASGERTTLLAPGADPRWVRTGHLLFLREATLMAVPFDPRRLEVQGEPVPVLEGVMQALGMPNSDSETWAGQLAVSRSGHLAYAGGGAYPERASELIRVSGDGVAEPLGIPHASYGGPRLSPDGDRVAFYTREGRAGSIHVLDLARGVTRRMNTGGFTNRSPVWSPDGRALLFTSDREDGVPNIYTLDADGTGEPERRAPSDRQQRSMAWSADGVIVYSEAGDLWVLPRGGDAAPFFTSPAGERFASFSPDGRWLAYVSDEAGRNEVYVRPYPGPEPATLISVGYAPAWSADGRRLYFVRELEPDREVMMAVDLEPGEPPRVGRAETLFDPWTYLTTMPARSYEVLPDGSLLAVRRVDAAAVVEDAARLLTERRRYAVTELRVVLNWFEELGRRMGER